ncbi:hypothetical protein PWG71_03200 [Nocardiopsis sp. N85]|uniref:hypothetical protein n=1 Tax=Nocardiopsis sp. N85 TaxID=3029400 RepID=UPI00237FA5FA|nr:hypothetical protein [Nocardiopsis sp. N85]MDE3720380.1 hypothetical protein [Nocardiopsis sp. N85]
MTPAPGDEAARGPTREGREDVLTAHDRAGIDAWARAMGTTVRQVDEDWESITYEAESTGPDGVRLRCRYRYRIPPVAAMRRLARTHVVGMVHEVDGARCHHVRRVIPMGTTDSELRHNAVLIASALIDLQRHGRCGAGAATLVPYMVVPALEWEGRPPGGPTHRRG